MKKILFATSIVLAAGAAHSADGLDWDADTFIEINGYNGTPFNNTGLVDAGWLNSLIEANFAGSLKVTFLGKEAGHTNNFAVNTGGLVITNNQAVGSGGSINVDAGKLNFTFTDATDGTSVSNGVTPATYGSYAVLGRKVTAETTTCDYTDMCEIFTSTLNGGQTFDLILGFNDGSRIDGDYDDMVIGLTLAVPEPQTYALMLAGLSVVGFMARRRKQLK